MEWLDRHAGAVQALASVATLVVTIVLACLTGWYVRVTKQIADSSLEQVEHIKSASRAAQLQAARSLDALSRRIRVPLASLASGPPSFDPLTSYALLNQKDVEDLEALARQVGDEAIVYAGKAAVSLRKLLAIIDDARSRNRTQGWMASQRQIAEWGEAIDAGPKMLDKIEAVCRALVAG
jgi:hypothetical protein